MKIALIEKEEGLKFGGIGVFSDRFTQYLHKQNHEFKILRFSNSKKRKKGIYYIPYYLAEKRSYIFIPSEKTIEIIKNHLLKIKPDIVYMNIGISPLDFLIPSLCHELKIPIAGVWHGDFNTDRNSLQMLVKSIFLAYLPFCKQLDLLHVFSEKLAQFYIRHGIDKKRITVIPNGVDPQFYCPGKSLFGYKNNIEKGVLFLGRLTFVKNPEILIKSFLELTPSQTTKLVLVGDGEQKEDLMTKYNDKRIIFTGLVKDEKKKVDIIRSCQIYVLPSRYEGMSLALLEAMSTGLACIATDAGANNILLDGMGILLSQHRLKYELPVTLKILFTHNDFCQNLGNLSRSKVQKFYSQEMIFAKIVDALEDACHYYKKRGYPKSSVINFNFGLDRKLRTIFERTRKLSAYFDI